MYLQERIENEKKVTEKSEEWAHQLARYAQQSVLYEAVLAPKPGLVDPTDFGAHKDMNIFTFMDSTSIMYRGFYDFAKTAFEHKGDVRELFKKIRKIGIEVEEAMFVETKGINTHKGVIFSMGIAIAATAFSINEKEYVSKIFPVLSDYQSELIFQTIIHMTEGLTTEDFRKIQLKATLTHGEKLYLEHGFLGIRGEAEAGFPSIREEALPNLRANFKQKNGRSEKDIYLEALFLLMSIVEDSTLVSRGGMDALLFVKETAKEFLENGGMVHEDAYNIIQKINDQFKAMWISPGGSADLLAVSIYFCKLEALE